MAMHEPTFLILTAIAEEPRHGYSVMQREARNTPWASEVRR